MEIENYIFRSSVQAKLPRWVIFLEVRAIVMDDLPCGVSMREKETVGAV